MDDLNNNVINTSTLLTDRLIGENGIISNVNCLFFGAYIGKFNYSLIIGLLGEEDGVTIKRELCLLIGWYDCWLFLLSWLAF